MHRNNILQKLNDYELKHPDELETIERFREFISGETDCFKRSLEVGHITGSAWLVNGEKSHVLLTHHRKLNRWLQLGGHADGDSDVLNVATKEGQEESGINDIVVLDEEIFDIDVHLIPARGDVAEHYHYDIRFTFTVGTSGNDNYIVSEESHDLAWIKISEMSAFTNEESMLRMARKWQITK